MSTYYPDTDWHAKNKPLYYVEFDRGLEKQFNTFTLFKRHYIQPQKEWDEMMKTGREQGMDDFTSLLMSNEGHPWNIMTDRYGPDGCMPDKAWVCWMVDALNEKVERTNSI